MSAEARLTRRLLDAGLVTGDDPDRALARVLRAVDVDEDPLDSELDQAVAEVVEALPSLFAAPTSSGSVRAPVGGVRGGSAAKVARAELERRGHLRAVE